ncbi:MAG: hypothetical protein HQL90_11115 [Magnetococcales bacterium]|nr:hypothetical protein [Magnetococcales bacterium]
MTTLSDIDVALCELSPMLQQLVEVVGLTAATTLAQRYGGIDLLVPAQFHPDHSLVAVIGVEAAQKLIRHHAGERIYIPKGAHALRCVRNRAILQAYDEGNVTAANLALRHRLTERQVRNILNQPPRHPPRQLSFNFDPTT